MTFRQQVWRLRLRRAGALLLFAGAGVCLAGAVREGGAFRKIDSLPLPPDGTAVQTVPLRSASCCDYRVVVRDTFFCRYTGARYDGVSVFTHDGESRPHNALELQPGELAVSVKESGPGVRVYTLPAGEQFAGQRVAARLDRERLLADLYLPRGAAASAFEGVLELELWERDRSRQLWRAGGTAGLAALLLWGSLALSGMARFLHRGP